jgi:hypothetical protein
MSSLSGVAACCSVLQRTFRRVVHAVSTPHSVRGMCGGGRSIIDVGWTLIARIHRPLRRTRRCSTLKLYTRCWRSHSRTALFPACSKTQLLKAHSRCHCVTHAACLLTGSDASLTRGKVRGRIRVRPQSRQTTASNRTPRLRFLQLERR